MMQEIITWLIESEIRTAVALFLLMVAIMFVTFFINKIWGTSIDWEEDEF